MRRRAFVQLAGGSAAVPLLPGCGGDDAAQQSVASEGQRRFAARAMAQPGARTYATGSGGTIYGGVFSNSLLDLVAAAAPNSWVRVNLNLLYQVWPANDYIPTSSPAGPGTPSAVIRAWSSFAWDPLSSRLILYGGGHANYDGNEVYVFEGSTRQWKLGFYASDVLPYPGGVGEYVTVDGPLHSPVSAHTYDNTAYLPLLDRYITFGGAAAHVGGSYIVHDGTATRSSGPYTLDLTHAGKGWVGGLAGSNVQRNTTVGVTLPGASAWAVRDYYKDHPDPNGVLPSMTAHISCGTAYAEENGHDVLYLTTRPGFHLHRIEFVDADYRNDLISRVGTANNSPNQWDATIALDPVKRVVLILGTNSQSMFWGWDISGGVTGNFNVFSSGLTGPGVAAWLAAFKQEHGIDFDPINNRFVLWSEGGQVFSMVHTGGSLSSNWYIEEVRDNSGTAGTDRPKTRVELNAETFGVYSKSDTGVTGKWKWASDLNAFVGLQHTYFGNVWIYKPANWVSPLTSASTSMRALQVHAQRQNAFTR
jgi:hypothetical protein